jgi:hypothetical protein
MFNQLFYLINKGEDRWLSTLLVQQGYYIVYCSAAISMTYSPETFAVNIPLYNSFKFII